MNNPTLSQASSVPTAYDQILVDTNRLLDEFERLLTNELHLLETGQGAGLPAIAEAKDLLVGKIGVHQLALIDVFEQHSKLPAVAVLKARFSKCLSDSRNNYALVMLELKHTNKSLELLRSVLRMDDLSLYSNRGTVSVKREKRRFGSA